MMVKTKIITKIRGIAMEAITRQAMDYQRQTRKPPKL